MLERDEETQRPTPEADNPPKPGEGRDTTPEEGREPTSEEDRRPTPVRMGMEPGEDEDGGKTDEARILHEEESGMDWVVTIGGRSASGILPLRTVPLMELNFAKAEAPDRILRQAIRYGVDLADITDTELLYSLRDSGPFRESMKKQDSPEKKNKKGKNRRSRRG